MALRLVITAVLALPTPLAAAPAPVAPEGARPAPRCCCCPAGSCHCGCEAPASDSESDVPPGAPGRVCRCDDTPLGLPGSLRIAADPLAARAPLTAEPVPLPDVSSTGLHPADASHGPDPPSTAVLATIILLN